MSDTPRTDREVKKIDESSIETAEFCFVAMADFARQLERELNEANRSLHNSMNGTGLIINERDQFRTQLHSREEQIAELLKQEVWEQLHNVKQQLLATEAELKELRLTKPNS